MNASFRDRATARLFAREGGGRWGPDIERSALRKLRLLDAATRLEDLRALPGHRLEKLAGRRAGQWSIRVNERFRVCFLWTGADAEDVEIVDYH